MSLDQLINKPKRALPSFHTILAVDDKLDLLSSIKSLLEVYGYRVLTASSGRDAITMIDTHPIDTIVLDLKMPDLNGHQVMDFLKEKHPDIPVIIVSGETGFDSVTKALKAGAYDFIRKPYVAEELVNTIKHAIKNKVLSQENHSMHEQVKHSESLHRFMVNSSPDIIYMLDAHGHFTYINDSVQQLLNIPKQALMGQHFSALLSEEEIKQHPFALNERRAGDRKTQNQEIQLRRRVSYESSAQTGTLSIPFEVSSMGIYEQDVVEGKSQYKGTYGIARDITARKQAESVIRFQAYHDLLTGLPNRSLLKDRLKLAISQAKRSNEKVVFMFLDLDRFKIVNDTLGHTIGDQLLQAVARRLQSCIREGDTLSRFGGDEFALLLPRIKCQDDATAIAEKIISILNEPFHIEGHELYLSASIGISLYPDSGENMDVLIQHADIAMYDIKGSGKNGFMFFTEDMNAEYSKRLSLEQDLRAALDKDQFEVLYQPQVNAITGQLSGLEALLRWNHPEHGTLPPKDFIAIAEETGCIISIGERVLEKVCTDLRRWNSDEARVAINFSLIQVAHPAFLNLILDNINLFGLDPKQIEIEITENVFVSDHKDIIEKLKTLSEHGIHITIDDFGTGYSSLSYLHQFPITTLKMDRSFINEIDEHPKEACIVSAIISMAKGLNLNLVAEGVETESQFHYLKNLGCHGMQGHLFSEAITSDAAHKIVKNPIIETPKETTPILTDQM
ncbi:MAG: EAL domain-containing protein [Pseudomonadales bacterium]|nr:EAL domain-containing protein [Pseudomonadales bacterium]